VSLYVAHPPFLVGVVHFHEEPRPFETTRIIGAIHPHISRVPETANRFGAVKGPARLFGHGQIERNRNLQDRRRAGTEHTEYLAERLSVVRNILQDMIAQHIVKGIRFKGNGLHIEFYRGILVRRDMAQFATVIFDGFIVEQNISKMKIRSNMKHARGRVEYVCLGLEKQV